MSSPGVYVSENLTANCDGSRAHNIRAREGEVIGSGSASSGVLRVAVLPTDAAIITSTGCGTWTLETPSSNRRLGTPTSPGATSPRR